jgi:D-alanyl-D-alanine carboxypeptidase
MFLISISAVAIACALFVALVSSAACDSANSPVPASPGTAVVEDSTPTPTEPAATDTPPPATAPVATTAAPTRTSAPGTAEPEDPATLVPCGLLAPVDQNHRVARDCVVGPLVNVEGFSLNADAADAYADMKEAAAKDGVTIFIISGYRDFATQKVLYDQEVAAYGPDQKTSAKPGHSEHQLGTTVDLNELSGAFGDSPAGKWLVANAHRFGFCMSYPAGLEGQTGYAYEPWHWRYLGGSAAGCAGARTAVNRMLGGG